MTIFGPIISAGSYASDLILNSIAGAAGTSLPDTCDAIRNFINGDRYTADLICMPTRLSGSFILVFQQDLNGWLQVLGVVP